MDTQLEDLITTLRTEAVERADTEAQAVLSAARAEADGLLEEARRQAKQLVADAEAQDARLRADGQRALQQAARDVESLLRQRLGELFDGVLQTQTKAALSPQVLADLIAAVVAAWKPEGDVTVEVSADDARALEGQLFAGLRDRVDAGLELSVSDRVAGGFRLRREGDDVLYNFDADTLAAQLRARLDRRLLALLGGTDG